MAFTIRGAAAQVFWGYKCAATLGSWTVEDRALSATVTHVDTFRVSQSPLTFVVGSLVRRPIEGLQIAGGTLTARLGPQKE
jgi:hypothetical protein